MSARYLSALKYGVALVLAIGMAFSGGHAALTAEQQRLIDEAKKDPRKKQALLEFASSSKEGRDRERAIQQHAQLLFDSADFACQYRTLLWRDSVSIARITSPLEWSRRLSVASSVEKQVADSIALAKEIQTSVDALARKAQAERLLRGLTITASIMAASAFTYLLRKRLRIVASVVLQPNRNL